MTVQTLERGLTLLRLIARRDGGWRLAELHSETGINKSTIHRLLATLETHGLVDRDEETRRYHLGPSTATLGGEGTRRFHDLREICRDAVLDLARSWGETAYLSVQSGDESLCLYSVSAGPPVQGAMVEIGGRRKLGEDAAGVMLLAEAPGVNLRQQGQKSCVGDELQRRMADVRAAGFAIAQAPGIAALFSLAVPIRDPQGGGSSALSLITDASGIAEPGLQRRLRDLRGHARSMEKRLVAIRAEAQAVGKIGNGDDQPS